MKLSKLFIGGHKELKRPMNQVDNGLLKRMEEASRKLRLQGKEVTAVMGPKATAPAAAPQPLRAVSRTPADDRIVAQILDRSAKTADATRTLVAVGSAVAMKRAS
jgi:hypothetical protein